MPADTDCLFCKIVAGDLPGTIVDSDELTVSFHTESPGAASITAYWTDEDGPQSETFTYTIAAPHR